MEKLHLNYFYRILFRIEFNRMTAQWLLMVWDSRPTLCSPRVWDCSHTGKGTFFEFTQRHLTGQQEALKCAYFSHLKKYKISKKNSLSWSIPTHPALGGLSGGLFLASAALACQSGFLYMMSVAYNEFLKELRFFWWNCLCLCVSPKGTPFWPSTPSTVYVGVSVVARGAINSTARPLLCFPRQFI